MVVSKIRVMLQHQSSDIRLHALLAIPELVQYTDIRAAICLSSEFNTEDSASIIINIVLLLGNDLSSGIRHSAHYAVMALGAYDNTRAAIFSGQSFFEIAYLLHTSLFRHGEPHGTVHRLLQDYDVSTYICEMIPMVVSGLEDGPPHEAPKVLAALILIMQNKKARESISPDLISQMGALLADFKWDDEQTLDSYIVLMQCDEFRPYFPFAQTTMKILPLLKHSEEDIVIRGLLGYIHSKSMDWALMFTDDVQNLPATVEQILAQIDGPGSSSYLRLMRGIMELDGAASVVAPLVCREVFLKLQHAKPGKQLEESYTELILMLPSSFDIPFDNQKTLMAILIDSDFSMIEYAVKIVLHFAPNVNFRGELLRSNLLSVCFKFLRDPHTMHIALQMIIQFSEYGDIRIPLINTPGMVHELLAMMKAGTSDIDRWYVGLRGLMALNLFGTEYPPESRQGVWDPIHIPAWPQSSSSSSTSLSRSSSSLSTRGMMDRGNIIAA
ncbi:hypothetical protein DFH06DRAFT_1213614 [Mycena polygramma]|nr:hypothetical protein DFH06DRAFT_1213614 [Mycena polygramma]